MAASNSSAVRLPFQYKRISPVRDGVGDIVQHFASFVDLTDHKQEQAQSRMLIDELNHRVKNTLATVQSIVWQALRNASDPEVIRESIESRLFALSRLHDLLTRENWEGAGLLDLLTAALEPFGVSNGRAEHFVIAGENIRVSPKVALALGIAFHELATNAVKYGAFSNKTGSVMIAWTIDPGQDGDRILLRWQERGGPPVKPPSRKGFGSRVIERGLAHELEGTVDLDHRADGVVCTIDFRHPKVLAMTKLLSGRRVLVVEDEMLILLMIEDMLADLGCDSVIAAATVDQALALIDAEMFDVAMLDMNLNGDKTFAVADALAARRVPFVFSTGYSGPNMRDDYRDRPVLRKPFMNEQLVEVLTRLLAR